LLIHGFYGQADVVCRKKKRFIFLFNKDLFECLTSDRGILFINAPFAAAKNDEQ